MISLIAAVGKNGEIGKNNHLIWPLKEDLAYFKKTTLNHKVIMGLNTYLSIGKPLKDRINIVLTTHPNLIDAKDVIIYDDLKTLMAKEINSHEEVFIIGGASLYKTFYPLADKLYITEIDSIDKDADAYFPKISGSWQKKVIAENEENNLKFKFVIYERKKNE